MASGLTINYNDFNNEKSSTTFRGVAVVGATYDAVLVDADALVAAIDDVTIATIDGHTFKSRVIKTGDPKPTTKWAQRELKWLVSMVDTVTGATSDVEIAGADLDVLGEGNLMDLTANPGLALKTAIEAFHRSNAGNQVTVLSVRKVGRNL